MRILQSRANVYNFKVRIELKYTVEVKKIALSNSNDLENLSTCTSEYYKHAIYTVKYYSLLSRQTQISNMKVCNKGIYVVFNPAIALETHRHG